MIFKSFAVIKSVSHHQWAEFLYVYSLWVSQEKIEAMAKAMVESGLADHGWTYINIDDAWQGLRDPESKVLQPNDKFPDMKAMCDHVHALGLKIGIYSTPWVGSYAGYIGERCRILKWIIPQWMLPWNLD